MSNIVVTLSAVCLIRAPRSVTRGTRVAGCARERGTGSAGAAGGSDRGESGAVDAIRGRTSAFAVAPAAERQALRCVVAPHPCDKRATGLRFMTPPPKCRSENFASSCRRPVSFAGRIPTAWGAPRSVARGTRASGIGQRRGRQRPQSWRLHPAQRSHPRRRGPCSTLCGRHLRGS